MTLSNGVAPGALLGRDIGEQPTGQQVLTLRFVDQPFAKRDKGHCIISRMPCIIDRKRIDGFIVRHQPPIERTRQTDELLSPIGLPPAGNVR